MEREELVFFNMKAILSRVTGVPIFLLSFLGGTAAIILCYLFFDEKSFLFYLGLFTLLSHAFFLILLIAGNQVSQRKFNFTLGATLGINAILNITTIVSFFYFLWQK